MTVNKIGIKNDVAAPFAIANGLARREHWREAIVAFDLAEASGAKPDAKSRLLRLIAAIRTDVQAVPVTLFSIDLVREADGRADLRRYVVRPLILAGLLSAAAIALNVMVGAYPAMLEDRRLLVSVLVRLKRWNEAIGLADQLAQLQPEDASTQASRIRLRLQAGRASEAASIARLTLAFALALPGEAHLWMMALMRDSDAAGAAAIALALEPGTLSDRRAAATAVQALTDDHRADRAIALGEATLGLGLDGAMLRVALAQAYLARGLCVDKGSAAMDHLSSGLSIAPDDVRLNSLYGETLLRTGRHEDAISFLEKCCTISPGRENPRALYARALKQAGRASEAADQFLALVQMRPDRSLWQRPAVACLAQAGRVEEASKVFKAFVERRSVLLPPTFEAGLSDLWQKLDSAEIPRARLDWAWLLRDPANPMGRAEWERAARWGYLADAFLLDWLECRDERADEVMSILAELDDVERFLKPSLDMNKGLVVATVHMGPMYAGPLALELLGIPSRWLASTPGMAQASYASNLISTSDKTEPQIAKASLRALQSGRAVCLAVDGAASLSAPRIPFEGQDITYASFAARAAYRTGAPSVFCMPRWVDGRIGFTFERLPSVEPDEEAGAYAMRWRRAFLRLLREGLRDQPENLRLSGGFWRHIRPAAKSPMPGI